jgi:hypothetical protein
VGRAFPPRRALALALEPHLPPSHWSLQGARESRHAETGLEKEPSWVRAVQSETRQGMYAPFANRLTLELTPLVRREPAMRRVCAIPRRMQSAECFGVRARADGVPNAVRELTSREHARTSQ